MNITNRPRTLALLSIGIGLALNGYSQSFITNGLVAYYRFDGNANDGLDTIVGGLGSDILFGGSSSDELYGDGNLRNAQGKLIEDPADGPDYIDAGAGVDRTVFGGGGDDVIRGGANDDVLDGGSGLDQLYGDDGDDVIFVGPGISAAQATALNDLNMPKDRQAGQRMFGGEGRDRLYAYAPTNDLSIETKLAGDQIFGGGGGDDIRGNIRSEVLVGGGGNDNIQGDALMGPVGDNPRPALDGAPDVLVGEAGEDQLFGGGGNDTMLGGPDTDILQGQAGSDIQYGGLGIDLFVLWTGAGARDDKDKINGHNDLGPDRAWSTA